MDRLSRRGLLLGSVGLAVAGGSAWGMGRRRPAPATAVDLAAMIPERLGTWRIDPDAHPVLPDEEQERSVADAYDSWIARVYRSPEGRAVMLVVAYGDGSSRTLAMHRPETCYSAQGFTVSPAGDAPLPPPYGGVIGRRLIAIRETRVEPVIFWVAVAGRQEDFGIRQNLAILRAAWADRPADAFLVRASTVEPGGFALVAGFLADMMRGLTPIASRQLGLQSVTPDPVNHKSA